MYFQEIYLFLLYYLTCANLEIGPSAASLAWTTFKGKFQDSPESLKVTMELTVYGFIFVLEHNTNGKKFGSQQLLIERLLGSFLGIKLTQILPRGLVTTLQSPLWRSMCFWKIIALSSTLVEVYSCNFQCSVTLLDSSFWNCLSIWSLASFFQVTQVQRYLFLQLLSRVSHKAWRMMGTGGDPDG